MAQLSSLAAVVCVLLFTKPVGQQLPDFSGPWKNDRTSSRISGRGNSPGDDSLRLGPSPHSLSIAQDSKTLTVIEQHAVFGRVTVSHPLDGRTVTTQILIAAGALVPAEITSQWKESNLVSTVTVSVAGETALRRYEQSLSLRPDGSLAIHVQEIGSTNSRTLVYRKQ